MALVLNRCCCGLFSNLTGSYFVACYACVYFTVTLTMSVLGMISVQQYQASAEMIPHLDQPKVDLTTKGLLMLMIGLASLGVASAVMLVVGLCQERPWLLMPVICTLSLTAIVDLTAVIVIIVQDMMNQQPVNATSLTLLLVDVFTTSLNLWCIVCVVSQYRLYRTSDGDLAQRNASLRVPLTENPGRSADVAPPSTQVLGLSATPSHQDDRPPGVASGGDNPLLETTQPAAARASSVRRSMCEMCDIV